MSAEFDTDEDFDRIISHVLSADPSLVDSVTAGDTKLKITATTDADWMTFEQAVRVAAREAPEEEHEAQFNEDERLAVVNIG